MGNVALRLVDQYTYRDMLAAYFQCRRHKRNTTSALIYEQNFELALCDLMEEVNSGAYVVGPSRVFTVTFPKPREVWAAQFRDRIVHHLVYNDVGPYLEARFIPDTFACIHGRGCLAAADRAAHFFRSVTDNWHKEAYSLQIDIRNFFVSINRGILWQKLARIIGEDSLTARLWKQIIFYDPTQHPIIRPGTDFSVIPRHKSLWHAPAGCGLPIGNLTSQVLANLYLDDFDHFVKHTLKAHCYVRYVDDALLLSHNREELLEWLERIKEFLAADVHLQLHPDKVHLRPAYDGLIFVGHRIRPWHTSLRPMTRQSALKAARLLHDDPFNRKALDSLNSYLGMAQHHSCFKLRHELCQMVCIPGVIGTDDDCTKIFYLIDM